MRGTVIFDLDGTLVDSSQDLVNAANTALHEAGLPGRVMPDSDKAVAFKGSFAMLRLGFERSGLDLNAPATEALLQRTRNKLLSHYEENIDQHTKPYPGAREAVDELTELGYRVGICTNKPEGLADLLLTRLSWRSAFMSLVGADTLAHPKPSPDPLLTAIDWAGGRHAQALLIGDTNTDIETGKAANVPVILADFEPFVTQEQRNKARACFQEFSQLVGLVVQLLS